MTPPNTQVYISSQIAEGMCLCLKDLVLLEEQEAEMTHVMGQHTATSSKG